MPPFSEPLTHHFFFGFAQDLKSSNILLVSMALIIICKLIGAEMIPPLLPLVQEKLLHPKYE